MGKEHISRCVHLKRKLWAGLFCCLAFGLVGASKIALAEDTGTTGAAVSSSSICLSIASTSANAKIGESKDEDSKKNTKKDELVDPNGAFQYKVPLNVKVYCRNDL